MKEKEFKQLLNDKIIFGDYDYDTDAFAINLKDMRVKHYKLYRGKAPKLKNAYNALTKTLDNIIITHQWDGMVLIELTEYTNKSTIMKDANYKCKVFFDSHEDFIGINSYLYFKKNEYDYNYTISDKMTVNKYDYTVLIICTKSFIPPIIKIFDNSDSFNIEKEMTMLDSSKPKYTTRNSKIKELKSTENTFNQGSIADKFNMTYGELCHTRENIIYDSKTNFVSSYTNEATGINWTTNDKDYKAVTVYTIAEALYKNKKLPEDPSKDDDIFNIKVEILPHSELLSGVIDISYSDISGIKYKIHSIKINDNMVSVGYYSPELTVEAYFKYVNETDRPAVVISTAVSEIYPLDKIYLRDTNGVPYLFVSM
jgi:hypothetical protein